MDQKTEQNVLSTLYTRLFEAITVTPESGAQAPFNPQTTFIQLAKNMAINPSDFENAASPANPTGNLNSAETFSLFVDPIPAIAADFQATANQVSEVYKTIVNGANTHSVVDPAQKKIYEEAYNYLNVETTIKDFTGKETTQTNKSPIYQTYLQNQQAYIAAVSGYRTAYLGYNMDDVHDQREWQARQPLLMNAVTASYDTWRAQGADQVEQALAALASSINSSVQNAIAAAREAVSAQHQMASNLPGGQNWLLSYAMPSNWMQKEAAINFSELSLTSKYLDKETNSTFNEWKGGASWNLGLWSIGGGTSGHTEETNYHMQAQNFSLSAKIGVVRVFRPWMHEFLFRMDNWFIDGRPKHGISNGKLAGNQDNLLPLIPTSFIVARDIEISGDFSTEDKSHIEKSISGSTSVGWGPFKLSGSYTHSSSKDTFHSTFDGSTIKVPGIQIIAFASEITPPSAPLSAPEVTENATKKAGLATN